ncbi:MAG: ADP-ribosylation factor-like protein [Candidatus Hermodarchaeota archaeon]
MEDFDFDDIPSEIKTIVKEEYLSILTDKNALPKQNVHVLRGLTPYHTTHFRNLGIDTLKTFADINDDFLTLIGEETSLELVFLRQKRAGAVLLCRWATDDLPKTPLKRIIITGLDNAGKTCTIKSLQTMQTYVKSSSTKGFLRENLSFLNYDIHLFDLGGQLTFREMYADEPQLYFSGAMGLIYVIDIQKHARMDEALEYLEDVIKNALEFNDDLIISVHMHKIDTSDTQFLGTASHLEMKIKPIMQKLGVSTYQVYHTSVYRLETLVNSFSNLFNRLSSLSQVLDDTLQFYAEGKNVLACLLYTEGAMCLGTYLSRLSTHQAQLVQEKTLEYIFKEQKKPKTETDLFPPSKFMIMPCDRGRWVEIGVAYSIIKIHLAGNWLYATLVDIDAEGGVKKEIQDSFLNQISPWIKNFFIDQKRFSSA